MSSSDKLHLGAYNIVHEGWVNTDVTPHLWIARVPNLAGALFKLGRISPDNYRRHQQGRCADVERIDNRPESLFMEAIK